MKKTILMSLTLFLAVPCYGATITKSIGTASRDFSTMTLWEANLDDDPTYDAGDIAVGECYADSDFTEGLLINGGGTIGLSSIKLTVPSAERHDGTSGTGVVDKPAVIADIEIDGTVTTVIEWLEVDGGGLEHAANTAEGLVYLGDATQNHGFANLIVHDVSGNDAEVLICITQGSQAGANILDCIAYDVLVTTVTAGQDAIGIIATSVGGRNWNISNNTVHKITRNTGDGKGVGIQFPDDAGSEVQNNISTDASGTSSGTIASYNPSSVSNATVSHNLASDDSDTGTGSIGANDGVLTANLFVSTVDGSEDLHLKSGANAIDVGTDLVTTPTGVNIDIDGRDRDAQGDTWDMGADEFVSGGTTDFLYDSTLYDATIY